MVVVCVGGVGGASNVEATFPVKGDEGDFAFLNTLPAQVQESSPSQSALTHTSDIMAATFTPCSLGAGCFGLLRLLPHILEKQFLDRLWHLLLNVMLPLLLLPLLPPTPQMRQKRFHIDRPDQLTVEAVETFYWHAIRAPAGGPASEPLLSLFTPAYKSGRKIQIPYNSLLTQTYQNWEWVIYDDSPPEHTETWRELSALRDRDYRIKIYKSDRNDAFIGSVKVGICRIRAICICARVKQQQMCGM